MLQQFFIFSNKLADFLFQHWNVNSTQGIIGICLSVASLSALLQLLKQFQLNISDYSQQVGNNYHDCTVLGLKRKRILCLSCSALIYFLQISIEYFLMLSVMTYNAWLTIAVVVGAAVGYAFIDQSPFRKLILDESCTISSEESHQSSILTEELDREYF